MCDIAHVATATAQLTQTQSVGTNPEGPGFNRATKNPRERAYLSAEGRSGGAAETTELPSFAPPLKLRGERDL